MKNMKYLSRIMIAFIFLLNVSNALFARQLQNDSLRYSGRFVDKVNKSQYARIKIVSDKNDWFTGAKGSDSIFKVSTTTDSTGHFSFKLPDLGKPYKLNFSVDEQTGQKIVDNEQFFTEVGDNVHVDVIRRSTGSSLFFSGQGADKYNLIYGLKKQLYADYYKEVNSVQLSSIKDSTDLSQKMEKLAGVIRKYKANMDRKLDSSNIAPEIKQIIKYEFGVYNGSFTNEWAWMTEVIFTNLERKKNHFFEVLDYKKLVGENYLRHRDEFSIVPDAAAKYSPVFRAKFASQIILEMMIRTNSDRINLKILYNLVKANSARLSKEVLEIELGHILLHPNIAKKSAPVSPYLRDSLLRDASKIIYVPYVKKAVEERIKELALISDTKVIDGEFLDLTGRPFSLRSLKGKVFLIDNWFNGCFGCASFHKGFDEFVYPKFKDNKNFVVLSVNIDKERDRWLSGIESKRYTSKEYINVTTGNWFDHPFLKYYNVKSNPWLMLVDGEGRIVYQPNGGTFEEMSSKIREALSRTTTRPRKEEEKTN